MKYDDAMKKLTDKTHVIFAVGEEDFLLSGVEKALLTTLKLTSEDRVTTWSATEHSSREVAIYLAELSLMGGRNIMILKDPTKLVPSKSFTEIMESMPEDSYLLVHCDKKVPKWMEEAKRWVLWVDCPEMDNKKGQLTKWVVNQAQTLNMVLTEPLAKILIDRTAGSMRRLSSEVQKLYLFVDGPVTEDAIKRIVVRDPSNDLIPVLDAIYARDTQKTLKLLAFYVEKTGSYLPFIALFQKSLFRLALISLMLAKNAKSTEIASATKTPAFFIAKEINRARGLGTMQDYKGWLRELCRIERQSRTQPALLGPKIENLLVNMTRRAS